MVIEIQKFLSGNPVIIEEESTALPASLKRFVSQLNHQSSALLPIKKSNKLAGIILLGGSKQSLTSAIVQPYVGMTDFISAGLEKIADLAESQEHLRELKSINSIQAGRYRRERSKQFLFHPSRPGKASHRRLSHSSWHYMKRKRLPSPSHTCMKITKWIPWKRSHLGEGLSSILIRTLQPLLLVEDTERQAEKLGAKIYGKPAKSWMGAPMVVQGEPIGALIVQDVNREHAFHEGNINFLTALANQVSGVIYNVRLLEESRRHTFQLETAAQIARDISGSLNLDELLKKAVGFIRERFNFYHASIFLTDLPGEFVVIREATGEAGLQMKRAGHKLGVGSKSVVGYVAGRGEPLVVNDTTKDATYYAKSALARNTFGSRNPAQGRRKDRGRFRYAKRASLCLYGRTHAHASNPCRSTGCRGDKFRTIRRDAGTSFTASPAPSHHQYSGLRNHS